MVVETSAKVVRETNAKVVRIAVLWS